MLHSNNIFELISCEPIQEDEDGLLVYKHTDIDQSEIKIQITKKDDEVVFDCLIFFSDRRTAQNGRRGT